MEYDEFKLLDFGSKGYDNIKQLKDEILKSFSRLDNKHILDKLNILKRKILESVYKVKSNRKLEILQYQQDIRKDNIPKTILISRKKTNASMIYNSDLDNIIQQIMLF